MASLVHSMDRDQLIALGQRHQPVSQGRVPGLELGNWGSSTQAAEDLLNRAPVFELLPNASVRIFHHAVGTEINRVSATMAVPGPVDLIYGSYLHVVNTTSGCICSGCNPGHRRVDAADIINNIEDRMCPKLSEEILDSILALRLLA